jgi:S-adenosylmethionine-dependent methyltransferase
MSFDKDIRMNSITADEYDAVVPKWKEWQSFPWGKLLYSISRFNIERNLRNHKYNILDVGGGNGFNSIYFAKQGHSVTLLDYSPAMLSEAKQATEREGLSDKITFCQADVNKIQDLFQSQRFDLIICHLMIEFVQEPQRALRNICTLLAPNGLLSVLDANRYSEVYRQAFQANDLVAAHQVIETKEYFHPWFSRQTPLFSSAEMIEILQESGCIPINDYGVLCLCAYLPNEPKYDIEYYNALEQLEKKLTGTYPYPLLARFYQVLVQKKHVVKSS